MGKEAALKIMEHRRIAGSGDLHRLVRTKKAWKVKILTI
jgi:hypothetical protein